MNQNRVITTYLNVLKKLKLIAKEAYMKSKKNTYGIKHI